MKRLLGALLALLVIVTLSPVTVAFAIADPDSPPQINGVYAYQDLLEAGDIGFLVDYYLDYDFTVPITGEPVPDETVTEAYLVVLLDTGGSTQIRAISPYTFENSGYGRGLGWIYFSASDAASLVWEDDYQIWLVGNPTLDWSGDPPGTLSGVDYWQPSGSSTATLLALRTLYFADILELAWDENMIESTSLGNRLTSTGASYFENVIANLRLMAPTAFSSSTYESAIEDVITAPEFGAIAAGDIVDGSPVTLVEGGNTITTTDTGTFTLVLGAGTSGTVEDDGGAVSGSPVDVVAGTNTITVTSAGTLTVTVELTSSATQAEETITDTGFDLTTVAARFGMSRWVFSGLVVWLPVSIFASISLGRVRKAGEGQFGPSGNKLTMLAFAVCIIIGGLLGLLHWLVAILLFIGYSLIIGLVIFYRGANV